MTNRNIKKLDKAREIFSQLEQRAHQQDTLSVPNRFQNRFAMATMAAAILYSNGEDKLKEMERNGRVHPSTISGGSLSVSLSLIQSYFFDNRREFTADNYEQLFRICDSAYNLIKPR